MAYQLEPLRKALLLPRVNLFIADDVGLGKTIEAGLIIRELLMRQKVKRIVVGSPASVLVPPHVSLLARLSWHFDGCAAEADAACSDCNHHERLWRHHDGTEASRQQQGSTDGTSAGAQRGEMKKAAEAVMNAPFCPCGKK